ncbi:MAG: SurA N-terminal domain-containing protein [Janthinobacterium lividum]
MRKSFLLSTILLEGTLLLLSGCHKGQQNGVVAVVNGKNIAQADVDKSYAAQLQNNPQQQPTLEQSESLKLNILHELIVEEVAEQRAAKLNLVATDAEVDAKLQEMKAPFTEDQFNARLKASNHTLDDVRRDLRRSLTFNKLLNKEINSKITVTDADVDAYFNAHKADFNLIETRYQLAKIIVTATPGPTSGNLQNSKATSDAEARKKVQALKNRLDAGEDFGTIAMNFSEDSQTASNGGDMGSINESQLKSNPSLFAAIDKLRAGQDTDIIPFPDPTDPKKIGGYAIFRLLEKAQAGQRDLSDPRVQQAIRQQIHDSRSQLLKSAYFEMLRDQAKVQNFLAEQIFKDAAK